MKRAFIGLFGMLFGAALLIPSVLIGKTFRGASAVSANPLIFGVQITGLLILTGFPMLYWVLLPVLERRRADNDA